MNGHTWICHCATACQTHWSLHRCLSMTPFPSMTMRQIDFRFHCLHNFFLVSSLISILQWWLLHWKTNMSPLVVLFPPSSQTNKSFEDDHWFCVCCVESWACCLLCFLALQISSTTLMLSMVKKALQNWRSQCQMQHFALKIVWQNATNHFPPFDRCWDFAGAVIAFSLVEGFVIIGQKITISNEHFLQSAKFVVWMWKTPIIVIVIVKFAKCGGLLHFEISALAVSASCRCLISRQMSFPFAEFSFVVNLIFAF